MRLGRFATLVCALALAPASARGDIVLPIFDGSDLPENQGWVVHASNLVTPLPFFSDGVAYHMDTLTAPDTSPLSGSLHSWKKLVATPVVDAYQIDITLKVVASAGHNYLDAPIGFLARLIGTAFSGEPFDRRQTLYFDEDGIGWNDDTGSFAMDTTDGFHLYTLVVDENDFAQVFVDGALALTRSDFRTNGRIVFGDMTNDQGVDGSFQLQSIVVTLVPEPSLLLLASAPVLGWAWRGTARRRGRTRERRGCGRTGRAGAPVQMG